MNPLLTQPTEPYSWTKKQPWTWIDRVNFEVNYSHTREVYTSGATPLPRFVAKIETPYRRDEIADKRPYADEFAYKVCKLFRWNTIPKTKVLHESSMLSEIPAPKLRKYSPLTRQFLGPTWRKNLPYTFTFQRFIEGCTLDEKKRASWEIMKMLPDLHSFQKALLLTLLLGGQDSRDDNMMFNKETCEVFLIDNEHIGEKCTLCWSSLKSFSDLTSQEIPLEILDTFLLVTPDQLLQLRNKYEARDQELMALWANESPPTVFDEDDMKVLDKQLDNIDFNFCLLQEGIKSLRMKNAPVTLITLQEELTALLTPPPSKPLAVLPAKSEPISIAGKRKEEPLWFEKIPATLPKAIQPTQEPQEESSSFSWADLSPESPEKKQVGSLENLRKRLAGEEPLEEIVNFDWDLLCRSPEKKTRILESNPTNLKICLQEENPFSFCFILEEEDEYLWNLQDEHAGYTPMEYAIKLADLESLQSLLDRLPSCPDSLPFFYMECLKEKVPPNLDILRLLLSKMLDVNIEKEIYYGEAKQNLLDCAINCMTSFSQLHTEVIEELLKSGVKVSKSADTRPFELLNECRLSYEEECEPFALTVQIAFNYHALIIKSHRLIVDKKITVEDRNELFLKRLYQYAELEKKYDPQASSHLTIEEFKSKLKGLEQSFEVVQLCSHFLSPQLYCFVMSADSLEFKGSSSPIKYDEKNPLLTTDLMTALHVFYRKITAHSLFFNALVNDSKFEDCFRKKQIQDLTQALTDLMKLYPLEGNGYLGKIGENFLPSLYTSKIKV
jgi:hypothetical protein